jgi:hypothetical protein
MTNLKTRADREIDRRITSLNSIAKKINAIKKLNAEEKSSVSTSIQQNITDLTALKTKIDADTDPTVLQTDVKSIVDNYRVYALYIPKIHILTAADYVTELTDKLTTLATKLATRVAEAKAAGSDVTTMETPLAEMQTKIADAKTLGSNAVSTVVNLDPNGYPGNKGSLQTALGLLQTARQDIVTAKQDAKSIVQALKALETTSTGTSTTTTTGSTANTGTTETGE